MYEREIEKYRTQTEFTVEDLRVILKILRSENGCPWDREQSHKTITKDLLEETYEVIEAIEAESDEMLREELGDLLLQVVFHTTIGCRQYPGGNRTSRRPCDLPLPNG